MAAKEWNLEFKSILAFVGRNAKEFGGMSRHLFSEGYSPKEAAILCVGQVD